MSIRSYHQVCVPGATRCDHQELPSGVTIVIGVTIRCDYISGLTIITIGVSQAQLQPQCKEGGGGLPFCCDWCPPCVLSHAKKWSHLVTPMITLGSHQVTPMVTLGSHLCSQCWPHLVSGCSCSRGRYVSGSVCSAAGGCSSQCLLPHSCSTNTQWSS